MAPRPARPPRATCDDNALKLVEGKWLVLEDGIEIEFVADPNDAATYLPGDYWLIPRGSRRRVLWRATPASARPRALHLMAWIGNLPQLP